MLSQAKLRSSASTPDYDRRVSTESYRSRGRRSFEVFDVQNDSDDNEIDEQDFLQDIAEIPQRPDSLEEKKRQWFRNVLVSTVYVLLWYTFSVSLSVYNKWMFSETGLDFNFPILTTSGHQLVQFLLASGVLFFTGKLGKSNKRYERLADDDISDPIIAKDYDDDSSEVIRMETEPLDMGVEENIITSRPINKTQTRLDWLKVYFISVVPCALASASDIGMGNVSFRFVTLTFYTMVKSSSLAWVLLFGVLFKLEVATRQLVAIIGVMSVGVVMMVAGETHFVLVGFLLVLGAAIFSGIRWTLTQLLLRSTNSGINTHNDPLRTIMYLSPVMGIVLFAMGGIIEGYSSAVHASLWTDRGTLVGLIILISPGFLAFFMTLSEFLLLGRTSVLTLSIAGILKELVTILSASLWFHDRMTIVNFIGLLITLSAIIAYNLYRYRNL